MSEQAQSKIQSFLKVFYSAFPFIFFGVLANALRRSHGFLKSNHLLFITLSFLLLLGFNFLRREKQIINHKRWFLRLAWLFSLFLVLNPVIYYPDAKIYLDVIRIFNFAIFSGASLLVYKDWAPRKVSFLRVDYVLLIGIFILLVNHILVIFASPAPRIDVFTILTSASQTFIDGINPYTLIYEDIYDGKYSNIYIPKLIYWPLNLYLLSAFDFLLGDIRFAYVAAHLINLIGLYKIGKFFKVSKEDNLSILFCWSLFPVTYFVLEQSWVEIFFLPALSFLFLSILKRHILGIGLTLGLICSIKQFAIFIPLLFFSWAISKYTIKQMIIIATICAAVVLSLASPFLIVDANSFIQNSVLDLLNYPMRTDSLSWVAHFYTHYKIRIPGALVASIYGVFSLFLVVYLTKLKTKTIGSLFWALSLIYTLVFILGKQAFCNYYYFLGFIIFLYCLSETSSETAK